MPLSYSPAVLVLVLLTTLIPKDVVSYATVGDEERSDDGSNSFNSGSMSNSFDDEDASGSQSKVSGFVGEDEPSDYCLNHETAVVDIIGEFRFKNNLDELEEDPKLTQVTQYNAQQMDVQSQFIQLTMDQAGKQLAEYNIIGICESFLDFNRKPQDLPNYILERNSQARNLVSSHSTTHYGFGCSGKYTVYYVCNLNPPIYSDGETESGSGSANESAIGSASGSQSEAGLDSIDDDKIGVEGEVGDEDDGDEDASAF